MLDENSCHLAMEKKISTRQSPVQHKNNGVICEKKNDFVSNKNGRQRKQREPINACRPQEQPNTSRSVQRSMHKNYRGVPLPTSDKRLRQRDSTYDRQGEEIVGSDCAFNLSKKASQKDNGNYLLKFSYSSAYGGGRGGSGRSSGGWGQGYKKSPPVRYSKEQFLQASCQFVVRDDSDYSAQAIDPDALVDWDKVELVRTFWTETVSCPICLQAPFAGKITKCGHTYCWACILRYLNINIELAGDFKCPVCPHKISQKELKSVQCIEVPDYKVGDEIEMKLMQKSKGSVYISPKPDWRDRAGVPHNIEDGNITNYTKILLASENQIKQLIDSEKASLDAQMEVAESSEICFIEIAKALLQERESKLVASSSKAAKDDAAVSQGTEIETSDHSDNIGKLQPENAKQQPTVQYIDAFENEEQSEAFVFDREVAAAFEAGLPKEADKESTVDSILSARNEDASLSLEDAAEELELPDTNVDLLSPHYNRHNKDTYYFYQASTGQQIYLNSLNAQCLTKEYGSLDKSPDVIKGTIVAIERIFMTEHRGNAFNVVHSSESNEMNIRKRLRYLNHIPLTCEFHVVELKLMAPIVSKETLRHFQPEFDKRHKERQKKSKEEKAKAKHHEVEYKKSIGIFPEVEIPLNNLTDFPSHLSTLHNMSSNMGIGEPEDSTDLENRGLPGRTASVTSNSPGQELSVSPSILGASLYANKLKEGKSTTPSNCWPRNRLSSAPSLSAKSYTESAQHPYVSDDEDCGGLPHSYQQSFAIDLSQTLEKLNPVPNKGNTSKGKKTKNKPVLLFSNASKKQY